MKWIFFVVLVLQAHHLRAEGINPADRISQNLIESKKKLELQEQKARQILSALYQIQIRTKDVVKKKASLLQQKAQLEQALEATQSEMEKLQALIEQKRQFLGQRIKTLGQLKGQSFFQVLARSSSPVELDRNFRILSAIAQKDLSSFKEFSQTVHQYAIEKEKLSGRLEKMKSVETNLAVQEKSFWKEQSSRKIIFEKIQKDKKQVLSKINQLKQASQNLQMSDTGLLDMLLKPSFLDQRGQLVWPVNGVVKNRFGYEKNNEQELQLYHKGVFIEAPQGQPVKAVFEGKVVYTGQLPGLGSAVVLDHGDHFYSIYANADQIYVANNTVVTKLQKIASVGEDVTKDQSGIYFEIRHFSEPSDPSVWMKGTAL